MKDKILQNISTECPWRDTLYWYDTTTSTNTQAKQLAKDGAAHGTVLIAGQQTQGRGRLGRTFQSPPEHGVYLSVILRPNCPPAELMHLTCAAGVAMTEAIRKTAGFLPGIKWINDLVWQKKKLGGILTELSVDPKTGLTEYAIVGIGINCLQQEEDFPAPIREIAVSLAMITGQEISREKLAGRMVTVLWEMDKILLTGKPQLLDTYRSRCVTLGQPVMVLQGDARRPGIATAMDDAGALMVTFSDGHTEAVNSGEVSVRGFYDYV